LQRSHANAYVAFDFFVTAEHLLDWQYPGDANKQRRTDERRSEVLLQICSHIATGGKHFQVESPHHQSVKGSELRGGGFSPLGFQNNAFQVGRLFVNLDGSAAAIYGPSIEVTALASKILDLWNTRLAGNTSGGKP
jgi:hypothetical protein